MSRQSIEGCIETVHKKTASLAVTIRTTNPQNRALEHMCLSTVFVHGKVCLDKVIGNVLMQPRCGWAVSASLGFQSMTGTLLTAVKTKINSVLISSGGTKSRQDI